MTTGPIDRRAPVRPGRPTGARLLVTDGDYKHALGIVRSLGREHEVTVAAARRLSMAGVSRWARRSVASPPPSDRPAFLSWLARTITRYEVDQVIPVGAAACSLLADERAALPPVRLVLATAAQMALALDKRRIAQLAASVGVEVPRTVQPTDPTDVAAAARQVGVPLVIKAPIEGSADVAYCDRLDGVEEAVRAWSLRNGQDATELPMLQQRIDGPGFGVFATYQDGRCRRLMAHRRVREFPPAGGVSSSAELVADADLLSAGRRVLDALAWHGVAMVEFKRDRRTGTYYVLEVNPKFWGSLDLALAAGCDFPGDLVRMGQGERLPEFAPPRLPLRVSWPLSGDLRHALARPRALPAIVRDLAGRGRRTNIQWTDPLPHVVEVAATMSAVVRRRP